MFWGDNMAPLYTSTDMALFGSWLKDSNFGETLIKRGQLPENPTMDELFEYWENNIK